MVPPVQGLVPRRPNILLLLLLLAPGDTEEEEEEEVSLEDPPGEEVAGVGLPRLLNVDAMAFGLL